MIKKLSLGVAILAALILIGVLYFKRPSGPSDAAGLVPADAVLFLNFPDLPRTALRWGNTALAKIGREAEVRDFLAKPLGRINNEAGALEASTILFALKPGSLFVSVTDVTDASADLIVGFQYWGGRKEFDNAVARMRKQLPTSGEAETRTTYGATEILSTVHGPNTVFSASVGNWGFVSNNEKSLHFALDRVTGQSSAPVLASDSRFQSVNSKLNEEPDMRFFFQPQKAINALIAIGSTIGAEAIPAQVEALRSADAVGATWKLDGLLQRDAIFALRTNEPPLPELSHAPLRFTSADTVLFLEMAIRMSSIPEILMTAAPEYAQDPQIAQLVALGVEAFGPEAGLAADWPLAASTPSFVAGLAVQDHDKAVQFINQALQFAPQYTTNEIDGILLYSLAGAGSPLASPTFALTDDFIIAGIDPGAIVAAAARTGDSPTLADAPAFAPARPMFDSANEVFSYVDTKTVFERAYTTLRPVIIFGASVMPDIGEFIDTSKLPQTETISKYLAPMVLSQQVTSEGTLIESSGPLTLNQIALASGLSAGIAGPNFLNR